MTRNASAAATGMAAQQTRTEVIANNLANALDNLGRDAESIELQAFQPK